MLILCIQSSNVTFLAAYPKLNGCGGFELLRLSRMTRSKKLSLLPCPSTGYTIQFIKDHIKSVLIYIRPMQKNIDTTPVSFNELTDILFPEKALILKVFKVLVLFDDKFYLLILTIGGTWVSFIRAQGKMPDLCRNLKSMSNAAGMHRNQTLSNSIHPHVQFSHLAD